MLLRRLFLCLRLLVASVAGSPAGGRVGVFLTLDLVVRCSSTSGARIEFWCPGTLCGSPVPNTPWRLGNLSIFLVRGYGSGFPPTTSGRSFIGGTSAGSCPLLWLTAVSLAFGLAFAVISKWRIPARVLLVAWLPLPRVWRSALSYIPLMLCASTGSLVNPGLS